MSDKLLISRRAFASGLAFLGLGRRPALAQGFAGSASTEADSQPSFPARFLRFRPITVRIRIIGSNGGT